MEAVASTLAVAARPRAFVRASGPDAGDYLQRMLSNDVAGLPVGGSCDALLLTPKARVVAPVRVWRRGEDDFLLLTEPVLGEALRSRLLAMRFAAKVELEPEEHSSVVVFGGEDGIRTDDYGEPAVEVLDATLQPTLGDDELELRRIAAGTPAWGKEIDDRVLPAEAGLVERAVSLTKGCYPGQEPIARLHYRGHANRGLRRLRIETDKPPEYDAELLYEDKVIGRVTSAVPADGAVLALAYVRAEVSADAELRVGDAIARPLH
jgi:folate-binding protein YgfZ